MNYNELDDGYLIYHYNTLIQYALKKYNLDKMSNIKIECSIINILDRFTSQDNIWCIIDVNWLQKWYNYCTNITNIPPGPITNNNLLYVTGQSRPQLDIVLDYRAISHSLWIFFEMLYGGGPLILRKNNNIYSESIILKNEFEKSILSDIDTAIQEISLIYPKKNVDDFFKYLKLRSRYIQCYSSSGIRASYYSANNKSNITNHKECSICLQILSIKPYHSLNCGHIFHEECIATWKDTNNICPLCRN